MIKRIEPKKLSGKEIFINTGKKKFSVNDFWRYAYSNLNSNVLRGSLAEFLVESALNGTEFIGIRRQWLDYDVLFNGFKIEVKCGSYLQDWDQDKLSKIIFSGLKAKDGYWSSAVGPFNANDYKKYKADIYVFALLHHKDPSSLNILDLSQWCFYVMTKNQLESVAKGSCSVSLTTLEKSDIKSVSFEELKNKITDLSKKL
jgi:hypothetical protein